MRDAPNPVITVPELPQSVKNLVNKRLTEALLVDMTREDSGFPEVFAFVKNFAYEAWKQGVTTGSDLEFTESYIAIEQAWGSGPAYEYGEMRRPKPIKPTKDSILEDFDALMSELDGSGNYSNCAGRIRSFIEGLGEGNA